MKRLFVVALLMAAACSGTDTGIPSAATLTLRLAGGTGNDGAVLVVVSGGPVSSVDVPAGYQVATNADGAGTHILVVGNVTVGAFATIAVPDGALAAAYAVTVVQVSDRTSFALLDPARYQVTIGP